MKAKDIEIGGEYLLHPSHDYRPDHRTWDLAKVVVLEAPTVGWRQKHEFRYTRRVYGEPETWSGARKDHALVRVIEGRAIHAIGHVATPEKPIEDRVPLSMIREPWADWEARLQKHKEAMDNLAQAKKAEELTAEELNARLEALGIDLALKRGGYGLWELTNLGSDIFETVTGLVELLEIHSTEPVEL